MATVPRFCSTINGQFVFVSRNHTGISNIKLSTHIWDFVRNKQAKKHVKGSDITKYPVSKLQNLIMPCINSTEFDHVPCQKHRT